MPGPGRLAGSRPAYCPGRRAVSLPFCALRWRSARRLGVRRRGIGTGKNIRITAPALVWRRRDAHEKGGRHVAEGG